MNKTLPDQKKEMNENHPPLTPRETEIMTCLARGLLDKEIAYNMNIALQTVKNHLKNIYHKMKVKNRLEATIKYYNFSDNPLMISACLYPL